MAEGGDGAARRQSAALHRVWERGEFDRFTWYYESGLRGGHLH